VAARAAVIAAAPVADVAGRAAERDAEAVAVIRAAAIGRAAIFSRT